MTSIESFIDLLKQRGKQASTIDLAQELLEHYYEFGTDRDLEVELLDSVLSGSACCRFSIWLPV